MPWRWRGRPPSPPDRATAGAPRSRLRGRRRAPPRGRAGREPSGSDQVAQLLEALRPDARDRIELVDAREGPVLPAIVEDLLGRTAQPSGWAVLSTPSFYPRSGPADVNTPGFSPLGLSCALGAGCRRICGNGLARRSTRKDEGGVGIEAIATRDGAMNVAEAGIHDPLSRRVPRRHTLALPLLLITERAADDRHDRWPRMGMPAGRAVRSEP